MSTSLFTATKLFALLFWVSHTCADSPLGAWETVRLSGGRSPSEGRVEVRRRDTGEWGLVCDDYWDIADAHVVCRELGFPFALRPTHKSTHGSSALPFAMDDVRCKGSERRLHDCKHRGWGSHNCAKKHEVAGVVCGAYVRLVGGRRPNEGRVEVRRPDNGKWGPVCDDHWNKKAAHVVCTELGYPGALQATHQSQHGWSVLPFAMDDVQCTGSERRLRDCKHRGWGSHNCAKKHEAAGVVCGDDSKERMAESICTQPADSDVCGRNGFRGRQIWWRYDAIKQRCVEFYYGGCNKYMNRFRNHKGCMAICRGVRA